MNGRTFFDAALATWLALLTLPAWLATPGPAAAAPVSLSTPHPAVCRVVVEERDGLAFGSGTLIDARGEYGLVVTNWHVVREATGKIEVVFPSGFKTEARPLKLDETWDLAALVVWRPPTEPVALAPSAPTPGEPLTICGYGRGDYRAAPGRCTDYYSPEVGMPQELVELDVEARQGDSGGPIFNARGEMAGVLFGAGQGTTLGSFGGRVGTFLATLAPDIGAATPGPASAPQGLVAAASAPGRGRQPAQDPFLAAERVSSPASVARRPLHAPPSQSVSGDRAGLAPAAVASTGWPSTLADKPTAPNRVVAKQPATTWQSTPATTPPEFGAVAPAAASFEAAPPNTAHGTAITIDWWEDGRTLLALFGIAALVIHGVRAMG